MATPVKTEPKTEQAEELAKIIKRLEDKIEKLQKKLEDKDRIIREKDERLSKVDDRIATLEGIAVTAQSEVQKADTRHSEELELVLNRINELAALKRI